MRLSLGGLLLIAMALVLLTPSRPSAGYAELDFNQNLNTSGTDYLVNNGAQVAQSFVPWEPILLERVSLYVFNDPPTTDALNVTIQSDAPGSPSGIVLASSEFVYSGTGWRAFPVTPAIALSQGVTYWIVAYNANGPNAGYGWRNSGADVVPGEAMRDTGSGWTPLAQDLTYQVYGLRLEPFLSFQFVGDRPLVAPGDVETYTFYLNNSGSRSPQGAWVNLTLPAGLRYEADTSGPLGGTRNDTSWFFPVLGNGAHWFSVAVSVGTSAIRYLNATARLNWTDSTGAVQLPRSGAVSIQTTQVLPPGPGPEPQPTPWYLWLLPLGVGFLILIPIFALREINRPRIEELFVIHTSGVLLYHLGRSMKDAEDKDSDVLGSMFTVVQDFVRESFRYGEDRQLNKLEFGDYKILIERGPNLYLAIATSEDVESLANRARQAVLEIEEKYGSELAKFSGRMEPLMGIRDLVKKHMRLS